MPLFRSTDPNQALIKAVKEGDLERVRNLLDEGADVNARCGEPLIEAVLAGHTEIVQLLLERGADPDAKDEEHAITVLMYAAQEADVEIVRLLLGAGAGVNVWDWMGQTAWMYADQQPQGEPGPARREVKRLLKEAGARQERARSTAPF